MICNICGKSEMAMRAAHKECIDDLWRRIAERNEEAECLQKEVTRLSNVVKAYEILINNWGKEVEGE